MGSEMCIRDRWWWRDGRVELDLFRSLTRGERGELDDEVDRVTALLAD